MFLKFQAALNPHTVAMVTYYKKKRMTATCVPMIGHLYDTIILASLVKQWLLVFIHQSVAVRKLLETVAHLLNSSRWLF